MADDFGDVRSKKEEPDAKKYRPGEKGETRPWIKVFETLPAQLLNVFGEAKYAKMSDEEVWKHFDTPLSSGAQYMTELCSKGDERRGIGLNRWLHAMVLYCEYQKDPETKKKNEALLKEDKAKELYAEIDRVLPSLKYCLAPKKETKKSGAATLRSSGAVSQEVCVRDPAEVDKHAKVVYEWLDTKHVSRIRMLAHWQTAAVLSHVSATHHRAAQCFRYQGNAAHCEGRSSEVCLEEFQRAIKNRLAAGGTRITDAAAASGGNDYA